MARSGGCLRTLGCDYSGESLSYLRAAASNAIRPPLAGCPHPRMYACLDGVSGIKTPMLPAVATRRRTSAAATHTLRVDRARVIGSKGPLGKDFGGAARERMSRGGGVVAAVNVGPELGGAVEVINNLGLDTLTFLAATVLVIPAFKLIKASPILGFLLSGVVLSQFGLIRNVTDVKALSELGILFLLFEMGLELSLARLKALAKYAFGMGLPQVLLCTAAFAAFELPPNRALGTQLLEYFFNSRPDLVNIRSVDEAIVIGAALSLSSSAFVLQLLAEKGELPTRFGSATLGILLLQDIAVVPLLVILPILETGDFTDESVFPLLAAAGLKALLGLGILLLAGRLLLRRFFEVVAESRSPEAFVALCLLTVTGTSLLTQKLGFSDSLGAFLAGALLAETNYRTQVEADIRPFRGLLLGLFFVTTGTSIDFNLLTKEWPNIFALLAGLIAIKTTIITALGPRVGLTLAESVRTGLLLSQGGEFAFVVFSLANQLGVLPLELNRLLIIVVVLSMALTPALDAVGRRAAAYIESRTENKELEGEDPMEDLELSKNFHAAEPVVIVGFDQMGQVLANFLSTPLASGSGVDSAGWPYISFDLDPGRVKAARRLGFPVLYGDGSRPAVLQTAGISRPKAVMVMYTAKDKSVESVERLRLAYPGVPIYARAQDLNHLLDLRMAGCSDVVLENAETSLRLGSVLLQGLGCMRDDVVFLRRTMRESMDQRAREAFVNRNGAVEDAAVVGPFQDAVRQGLSERRQRGGRGGVVEDLEDDPVGPTLIFDDSFPESDTESDVYLEVASEAGFVTRRASEAAARGTTRLRIPKRSETGAAAAAAAAAVAANGMAAQGGVATTAVAALGVGATMAENGVEGNGLEEVEEEEQRGVDKVYGESRGEEVGGKEGPVSKRKTRRRSGRESDNDNPDKRGVDFCSLDVEEDSGVTYYVDGEGSIDEDMSCFGDGFKTQQNKRDKK